MLYVRVEAFSIVFISIAMWVIAQKTAHVLYIKLSFIKKV